MDAKAKLIVLDFLLGLQFLHIYSVQGKSYVS